MRSVLVAMLETIVLVVLLVVGTYFQGHTVYSATSLEYIGVSHRNLINDILYVVSPYDGGGWPRKQFQFIYV